MKQYMNWSHTFIKGVRKGITAGAMHAAGITAGTVHAAVHELVSHLYKGSKERDNSRGSACSST